MSTATLLYMNQEETHERDAREERHTASQRDIREIKMQMDRLTGSIGEMKESVNEMKTALKGNDLGTEGLVGRMVIIEEQQSKLKHRLDDIELATSKKQMYLFAFVGTICLVVGGIIKAVFDKIFK